LEFSRISENLEFIKSKLGTFQIEVPSEEKIGELAYSYYWDYNCEYAVITAFNEKAQFPMTYSEVRTLTKKLPHKWGVVCGALTGAFFLFSTTLKLELSVQAAKELIDFHNITPLPIFKGRRFKDLPKVAVGSILCRDSILNWSRKAGVPPRSLERAERCAAITADVAMKTVQLIKKYYSEPVEVR